LRGIVPNGKYLSFETPFNKPAHLIKTNVRAKKFNREVIKNRLRGKKTPKEHPGEKKSAIKIPNPPPTFQTQKPLN